MMLEAIPELWIHLTIIISIFLVTWLYSLKGGYVSDDHLGVSRFSDKYDAGQDKVISTYKEGDKEYGNTQFNPKIGFPSSIVRWIRLNIGRKFVSLGNDKKGHAVFGYIQDPFHHHVLSLSIHLINVILAYFLLSKMFGTNLALFTVVLFIVHPVSCQTVAWISGIGYLLCLMWSLITFNIVLYVDNLFITVHSTALLSFLAAYGLFSGAFNWIILVYFKAWIPAAICFAVFVTTLSNYGLAIVKFRKTQFKSQNMGRSTSINWRKPIVMVKTLLYYVLMTVFPYRLGLFHKWGYHYEERIEKVDSRFWVGLSALCFLGFAAFYGPDPVKFGVVWFVVYLLVFSNFITAMQFIADRYAFISTLGYSLVLSYYTKDYPVIYGLIVGAYLVRTWMHLPTFKDDQAFYKSNCFNFPTSEVALGNLGVTYMNIGRAGSAVDAWYDAIKINKNYDVPHYNLYSIFKSNGQVQIAYEHLKNCINSKPLHFPDMWTKEFHQVENYLKTNKSLDEHRKEINRKMEVFR